MTHQDEMFITALGIEESSNNSRPRIRKGHIAVENLVVNYHRPEKLPESVLFPSIVEGVLREAWFIGMPGNSRLFWRQELTSKEFKNIATDGYWWCVLYDVQKKLERNSFYDSSSLDSEEQTVLERDPIFGRMASSYASIFKRIPQSKKDLFFSHFPEALAYSILACITQAHPKQRSQFDDPNFRARLVERCSVWVTGFRPYRITRDHWVVNTNIQTTTTYRGQTTTSGLVPTQTLKGSGRFFGALDSGTGGGDESINTPVVPVRAAYKISNSPFMQRYLKDSALQPSGLQALKVALTQDGERQVLFCPRFSAFQSSLSTSLGTPMVVGDESEWKNLNPGAGRSVSVARARRRETPTVDAVLQQSNQVRNDMLAEYENQKTDMRLRFGELRKKLRQDEADLDLRANYVLRSEDLTEYAKAVQVSTMNRSDFTQRKIKEERAARSNEVE